MKRFSVQVHKLAKYQWFGASSLREGVELRHLDGNRQNNRRSNLALGSHADNMQDVPAETRLKKAKKAAFARRRLSMQQANALRRDRRRGMKYSVLTEKYGVCKSIVSYIVNNKMYKNSE